MYKSLKYLGLYLFMLLLLVFYSCSKHAKQKLSTESILQQEEIDTSRIIHGIFDIPEIAVTSSPNSVKTFQFPKTDNIVGYDVSPLGPMVAAILEDSGHKFQIKFWQINSNTIADSCKLPDGYQAEAIVWHPRATSLFILTTKEKEHQIFRIGKNGKEWATQCIFSSANSLKNLIVCPRPFIVGSENDNKERKEYYSYRLFFGMDNGDQSFRIVSVTENGKRFYQVIGPAATTSHFTDSDPEPSIMKADFALPIAFHPAGHQLIWENKKQELFVASYDNKYWGEKYKPLANNLQPGTVMPTPNGLALLHWQKDKPGIKVFLLTSQKEDSQATNYQFLCCPSSVADGSGIVGLTKSNGSFRLNYLPIEVPLADVVNGWMYSETLEETDLLKMNHGLFRTTKDNQLYELYDTENYHCGDYDRSAPTRPYMVTTDIFWELFGAAYEGLFIVKERDKAIPTFWEFITKADLYYKKQNIDSKWAAVFQTIVDLKAGKNNNPEVLRIEKGQAAYSNLLKKDFDYAELKPRGHYTSSSEMKNYFKAFKYLTNVFAEDGKIIEELNLLPSDIKIFAKEWIDSYSGFIAPSRNPLVWKDIKTNLPAYNQYPGIEPVIFPLSWGFDNEVLYSTVFHDGLPADQTIAGPGGERLLASGLDLASALGNQFAESLLEADYGKYPPLRKVIDHLKENFKTQRSVTNRKDNLYDRWINALAVQWADTVTSANGVLDKNIWQAKRLQTGLASWATLRHATGLVNERSAAECGEGGFEEILLRAPRGYVEQDPYTFGAIADLFETAIQYVSESTTQNSDIHGEYQNEKDKTTLYDGIVKRLKQTAKDARSFQWIAEKEKMGKELTNEEYEEILYVGRVAEHCFLIFKSLANKDYALSTPDPIAKIADVAGSPETSYVMAAVGNPLEWDYVVPYFGRHAIVKGSIYSYYEFSSTQLLNDKEWNEKVKKQAFTKWTEPYITEHSLSSPAVTKY